MPQAASSARRQTPVKRAILQAIRYHAQQRWLLSRRIAGLCQEYLRFYENINWHPESNGECRLMYRLTPIGMQTIFDVGANRGDWVESALSAFPDATIHAFEIAPPTFDTLQRRYAADTRVIVNCCGLSDVSGTSSVHYYCGQDDLTTLMHDMRRRDHESTVLECQTWLGDDYCEANKVPTIDFVKIDTEGADYLVLKGFDQMLSKGSINIIQFEYIRESRQCGIVLRDYYEYLAGRDYNVGKLFPRGVIFGPYDVKFEELEYANYVAVKRGLEGLIRLISYS